MYFVLKDGIPYFTLAYEIIIQLSFKRLFQKFMGILFSDGAVWDIIFQCDMSPLVTCYAVSDFMPVEQVFCKFLYRDSAGTEGKFKLSKRYSFLRRQTAEFKLN